PSSTSTYTIHIPVMEKAARLTGRTIQAVIELVQRQDLTGLATMLFLSSRTVLVLLWLAVEPSPALAECPPDRIDPEYQLNLTQGPAAHIHTSTGSLEPLYNFARLFLLAVQPYGLPLDTASRALQNEAPSSEVLLYEAGYVVCFILAVLYILIIPIVGAVLACRHFRSKNVLIESPSPSPLPWHRRNVTVITCLSVVVILLLSGVILTFTTNERMRHNMRPNLSHLGKELRDIENALSSIPQTVDSIVEKFSIFQEELTRELNETGELIGQTILLSTDPKISILLNSLNITVQDATGAQRHLLEVKDTRQNMQDVYALLNRELNETKKRLDKLNSTVDTSNLETDANYDMVERSVSAFPGICTDQSTPQIEDMFASLDKSKADIEYYDYIRWSVSVAFCTLILIITLLMLAGLIIGASVVISPTLYPFYLHDQLRLTAVNLLYVASGMIFIFSWLFIIMVFINLFFGGNAHALACRSWVNGEIYKFLDKQDLFTSMYAEHPDFVGSTAISPTGSPVNSTTGPFTNTSGIPERPRILNVSTSEIYQGCQIGRSMFYSIHMNETFSMDAFLNTSMYLMGLNDSMQALSFDLSSIQLLPYDTKTIVQRFRDSSSLDQIKYDDIRTLMARPVVKTDLDALAAQLEKAALNATDPIRENLTSEAAKVRQLANTVRLQDSYRRNMTSSIEALAPISLNYWMNADRTLQSASEAESSLQLQVPYAVQNVSQCMVDRATELLREYFDFVRFGIIDEALGCSWLPVSLSNMYTATCENLIGPWNAFWLCLGWCCAFLVPGVIFSILAAQIWKPPASSENRALFHMPDDIIDKEANHSCMTLDSLTDKGKKEDTKKTLDEVFGCDKGKKEKWSCSTKQQ
ncbi:hypothetical protein NFI96_012245, partial [Prochilodus magdalenae]